jgi:hypothetical protein
MNCLCSLGRGDRGFESHLGHGFLVCICIFFVCVSAVLRLGRGLATSWSLIKGILSSVSRSGNWKEARAHKGCRASKNNAECTRYFCFSLLFEKICTREKGEIFLTLWLCIWMSYWSRGIVRDIGIIMYNIFYTLCYKTIKDVRVLSNTFNCFPIDEAN